MKKIAAILLSLITVFSFSSCTTADKPQTPSENSQTDQSNVTVTKTVHLKYYNSAAELIPALKTGVMSYGVLPEPAATNLEKATASEDKVWYRLDIQELYDGETKSYPQAVMLIKESLLNTYPQLVGDIAAKFADNAEWVALNPAAAVTAVNSVIAEGVTPSLKPAALTADTVKNCNISWQSANAAKTAVVNYLNDIISLNSVSAKAAGDDFFYNGNANGDFLPQTVKVFAPDGAPALAIAKFISDNETFGTDKTFEYSVVASDSIGATVQQGKGDVVILPLNAASKLYDKYSADPYKMVSVITHGNLYLMCSENITANDFKDKTVGIFGMGLVPDLTFGAVLKKLGYTAEIAD